MSENARWLDGNALGGLLQADTFQMAVEDFLGLANHLAGKGGLIVDALLKHGRRFRIPLAY